MDGKVMQQHIINVLENMCSAKATPKFLYISKQADECLQKRMPNAYTTNDDGEKYLTINGITLRVYVLPMLIGFNAIITQDGGAK